MEISKEKVGQKDKGKNGKEKETKTAGFCGHQRLEPREGVFMKIHRCNNPGGGKVMHKKDAKIISNTNIDFGETEVGLKHGSRDVPVKRYNMS